MFLTIFLLLVRIGFPSEIRPSKMRQHYLTTFILFCLSVSTSGDTSLQCHYKIMPGWSARGEDDRIYNGVSRDQCLYSCLHETGFVCGSADWTSDTRDCFMTTVNQYTSSNFGPVARSDYYELHCIGMLMGMAYSCCII